MSQLCGLVTYFGVGCPARKVAEACPPLDYFSSRIEETVENSSRYVLSSFGERQKNLYIKSS